MDVPHSIESLLLDPKLAGFSSRAGVEGRATPPGWVLEAATARDAAEARDGDIIVAGTPADDADARRLVATAAAAGAAALALPESCQPAADALPIVSYPAWLPRHAAASLLARALWPFMSALVPTLNTPTRPAYDAGAARPSVAVSATVTLRVLSLSYKAGDARSAGDSTDAARTLERYLPVGADAKSLPRGTQGERYLLLRSGNRVGASELRSSLRAAAQDQDATIGVSDEFALGEKPSEHAPRAREAAVLGMALFGTGHVSFYDNLYLYKAFIDDGRPDLLLTFSRETLNRLRDWDECHGSQLLKTLETYFELDRSVRKTAERLGIHRHTLRQRLERIEEATSCPVRGEGAMRYELILAYKHLSKIKL